MRALATAGGPRGHLCRRVHHVGVHRVLQPRRSERPTCCRCDDRILDANSIIWSTAVASQIILAPLAGVLVATVGAGLAVNAVNAVSFLVSAPSSLAYECLTIRLPLVDAVWPTSSIGSPTSGPAASSRPSRRSKASPPSRREPPPPSSWCSPNATSTSPPAASVSSSPPSGSAPPPGRSYRAASPATCHDGPVLRALPATRPGRPVPLAALHSFAGALAGLAAHGIGTSTGNVTYHTSLQHLVADERLGRVFAFYDVVWQTGRLASIGLGGFLVGNFGITPSTTSAVASSPPPSASPVSAPPTYGQPDPHYGHNQSWGTVPGENSPALDTLAWLPQSWWPSTTRPENPG